LHNHCLFATGFRFRQQAISVGNRLSFFLACIRRELHP